MKLTKPQSAVLELMGRGWELADSKAFDRRAWLQKGGAGRGGESKRVNAVVFRSLLTKGLIAVNNDGFPTRTWKAVRP